MEGRLKALSVLRLPYVKVNGILSLFVNYSQITFT